MTSDERFAAAAGSFSEEEERLHVEGFARIRAGLDAGMAFDEACAHLAVSDAELKRVIVDDFLKVTIAERNFQGGQELTAIAEAMRVPLERVSRAREEMLAEVAAASVAVFKQQGGEFPADETH